MVGRTKKRHFRRPDSAQAPEQIQKVVKTVRWLRRMPAWKRWCIYAGLLLFLPFYFGIAPRVASDVYQYCLIRVGWHAPLPWEGWLRESAGALVKRLPGAVEAEKRARVDRIALLNLNTPVRSVYDGVVVLDTRVAREQRVVAWILRSDESARDYYLFELHNPADPRNFCWLAAYAVRDGRMGPPLYIDKAEQILPMSGLGPDRLKITIETDGCWFLHHFDLAKRPAEDRSGDAPPVNIAVGATIRARFHASHPCLAYGGVGVKGDGVPFVLETLQICAFSDEKRRMRYCEPLIPKDSEQ